MPASLPDPKRTGPAPAGPADTQPRTGSAALPAALIAVIALLAYLGQAQIGYFNGGFSSGVCEPYVSLKTIPKPAGQENPVDIGRDIYARNCAVCHQASGIGNPANGCPPLAKSDWVLAEGPARLIRIVLHGAGGPITVNDQPWNGAMVAWGGILDDDAIAAVVTYIRQSPEWANQAAPVTAEQVKAVREATASRTTPWTAGELMKLPDAL